MTAAEGFRLGLVGRELDGLADALDMAAPPDGAGSNDAVLRAPNILRACVVKLRDLCGDDPASAWDPAWPGGGVVGADEPGA